MTEQEMRIAIAEEAGYRWFTSFIFGERCLFLPPVEDRAWKPAIPEDKISPFPVMTVPDYTNNLNAIHKFAHTLPMEKQKAMRVYLYEICGQMLAHMATANQFCQAVLMALGRWPK